MTTAGFASPPPSAASDPPLKTPSPPSATPSATTTLTFTSAPPWEHENAGASPLAKPREAEIAYRAEWRSSQIEALDLDVIAVHAALDRDGQVLSLVCGFQRGGGFLVTFGVEFEELAAGDH